MNYFVQNVAERVTASTQSAIWDVPVTTVVHGDVLVAFIFALKYAKIRMTRPR